MRTRWILSVVIGCLLLAGESRPQDAKGTSLPVLKYKDLGDLVNKQRGKVVLVDFWSLNCPPCLREFPHLVALQQKYGKDGLVTISVSTDPNGAEPAVQQAIGGWMQKFNSPFQHVVVADPGDLERLGIVNLPSAYVFNRQGKWQRFRAETPGELPPQHEAIEKVIVEFLQHKP